ncbi:MAG TPA: hypothetical protein VG406_14295 [Isosphaeraceae bacterium]|jgi:hypothetical protein|nr:hypothetical protein [Isosphaeraceae bacterium]
MHILVAGAFALALLPLVAGFVWWIARLAWGVVAPTGPESPSPASVRRKPS